MLYKEDKHVYDPEQILAWLVANVQSMHHLRHKALAAIVGAALLMKGLGVLALKRVVAKQVAAKHCIKRVWRVLRNADLEVETLQTALCHCLRPTAVHIIILVWMDIDPFQRIEIVAGLTGRDLFHLGIICT